MKDLADASAALERSASGPWTDLGLTLPIFVGYHLGVVFMPVRNAADWVTRELVLLADHSMLHYVGLTLAIGAAYVGTLVILGRRHAMRWGRFVSIFIEGVIYAIAMRMIAGYVIGKMVLGPAGSNAMAGLVMSLGAGFYEELAFRVGLYGVGARLLCPVVPMPVPGRRLWIRLGWALVCALAFSGWHYIGPLGDELDARSFVFRAVCGLVFTVIFVFRGFAPAVWTHALYDIWVLVF